MEEISLSTATREKVKEFYEKLIGRTVSEELLNVLIKIYRL